MTFSIIIPVYNVAPYLRECLDSVLAQTYNDWEAICVDDGSTDGSGVILDAYLVKDARFKVIHQANAGVSMARNAALSAAQGSFVWFVDADDAIHPQSLALVRKCFEKSVEIATVRVGFLRGADVCKWPKYDLEGLDVVKIRDVHDAETIRWHRDAGSIIIYRREVVGALRFMPYKIGEDVLFSQTIYWRTRQWASIDLSLYFYRTRDTSASNTKPSFAAVNDYLETSLLYVDMFEGNRDKWTCSGMEEYFVWKSNFSFVTYNGMCFRLGQRDFSKLLNKWIRLQCRMAKLHPIQNSRKLKIILLAIFRSVRLGRFLVLGDRPNWIKKLRNYI